jgi:hypothetical protein
VRFTSENQSIELVLLATTFLTNLRNGTFLGSASLFPVLITFLAAAGFEIFWLCSIVDVSLSATSYSPFMRFNIVWRQLT